MSESNGLVQIIEAALLAAGKPLSVAQLGALFEEHERPSNEDIRAALEDVRERCDGRGYELVDVASGFRFQVREKMSPWVSRLWQERPQKYSRALLETLALVAYRQPITRGEIEEIRGVAVSTNIIRTLHEREWIRVVGHRDVPGRPSMYATTRDFLDYFSLKSLDQLPALADIRDLETLNAELGFSEPLPEAANADSDSNPEDGQASQESAIEEPEAGQTDDLETDSVEADDEVLMTSQGDSEASEDSQEELESDTAQQATHGQG
ncbi:SMC-Scp complex subunit ScpB [Congregibacter sp.]|nr:SMC-Scp complex subunit ScpB [Congregibacter sp.]MDA8961872.1 SMC-Scp complex subunit ScpB [Congregibacter sp.]